jgi:hypothetical protein
MRFVSGPDFSRAVTAQNRSGFSPCGLSLPEPQPNNSTNDLPPIPSQLPLEIAEHEVRISRPGSPQRGSYQGPTFSRAIKKAARSAFHGSVVSTCQFLARGHDRTPRLPPKISQNPPTPQMWKICQDPTPKSKVITSHSAPLTSLYPRRYLAGLPLSM